MKTNVKVVSILSFVCSLVFLVLTTIVNLNITPYFHWINIGLSIEIVRTLSGLFMSVQVLMFVISMTVSNGKMFKYIMAVNLLMVVCSIIYFICTSFLNAIINIAFSIVSCSFSLTLKRFIDAIHNKEDQLYKVVYTDQLTGCINRRGMLKIIEDLSVKQKPFYLIFIDLDNFKQINDILGHDAGDELLKSISFIWRNLRCIADFKLCRLGGDEFAVVLMTDSKRIALNFASDIITNIKKLQFKFSSQVTASAGIAKFMEDTCDADKLISYADTAMYKAKISGKNNYCFFNQDIYDELFNRYILEKEIKDAIKYDKFSLMYQPQYDIITQKLIGFETLVRLKNDKGDFIDTKKLIQTAENTGLILDVDLWVLRNTMLNTVEVVKANPGINISVNLSGKYIASSDFIDLMIKTIEEIGFPPTNLKIEISEYSYINYIEQATSIVERLKNYGIKIVIDNFGSSYSSLNYLSKINIDSLKIDNSFIYTMLNNHNDLSFIDNIIKLGHLIGCKIVAEGVETTDQLETLIALNCDYVQGFVWGKPIELDNIESCIKAAPSVSESDGEKESNSASDSISTSNT